MAVTIHQTPEAFTPSDNPVVWTFSSNQTAQPNFVYIIKVYINDALISSAEMVFPESGIYARYDASNHASNNCNIPTLGSDLIADANNYCKVKITIVERYGSTPSDHASAAASNIVCWKAKMTDEDFIDWDSSDYIYGSTGNWLTNYPNYPKVARSGESIRLMFINNNTSIVDFKVQLFDITGDEITSDTLNFTATAYELLICNLSPAVIVASALAITDADFLDCAYYEVSANSLAGLPVQRIDIDESITYNTYKRIHFLSQWGTIDAISFGLRSIKMGKVTSSSYIKNFGAFDGSSFVFDNSQGRDIDYAKTIEREMKCISDWLPQALQNWMIYNLIGSPGIWVEVASSGALERRSVKARTIEEYSHENDMLFLEEITITLPTYKSMVL